MKISFQITSLVAPDVKRKNTINDQRETEIILALEVVTANE